MSSYRIDYLWQYNPHGQHGPVCMDQEITLSVQYYIQPDEPEINIPFSITIEEIMRGDVPLCTDANKECGWYASDEERLHMWLLEGKYANGTPVTTLSKVEG